MNSAPNRSYQNGTDLLLAGPRLTVLLPAALAEHADDLWHLVDGSADLDDLLEWLVDAGFRSFPRLLAVEHGTVRGTRLLLRGTATLTVARADGRSDTFSGAERRTWLDAVVPDAVQLWTNDQTEAPGLPLRHGVVSAAGFTLALTPGEQPARGLASASASASADVADNPGIGRDEPSGTARPVAELGTPASTEPTALSTPDVSVHHESPVNAEEPAQAPLPASVETAQPALADAESGPPEEGLSEPASEDTPRESHQPLAEQATAEDSLTEQPIADDTRFPDVTVDPSAEFTLTPPIVDEVPALLEAPDADVSGAAAVSPDQPGLNLEGDQYDQVFGATRKSTVEHAAVRVPEEEADLDEATAEESASPESVETVHVSPAEGDHDGRTIASAELARIRGAARVSPGSGATADPSRDRVRAAMCQHGHANPPNEEACRVCGVSLSNAALDTVDRPTLGVLAFDAGPRPQLDGTLIIGRSPKMPTTMRNQIPTLIAVDSPEGGLSRSHLEVRVEGWSVSVVDLGSTNGSQVTLPGEAPRRLRRGEPCLISPGTVVTLGDEVSATYEVGR